MSNIKIKIFLSILTLLIMGPNLNGAYAGVHDDEEKGEAIVPLDQSTPPSPAQVQAEADHACSRQHAKETALLQIESEIDKVATHLEDQLYQKKFKFFGTTKVNLDLLPAKVRDNVLARVAIERAAGAKIVTNGRLDHVFERELTGKESLKALNAIGENAFFRSLKDSILKRYSTQFVKVPAGVLPDGRAVASFEAASYPVTRGLWLDVMGRLPISGNPHDTLLHPLTFYNGRYTAAVGQLPLAEEFLVRLNRREAASGCTYDLPTDAQLHYLIRADVTGMNHDRYSAGVTKANVDEYITSYNNSNHRQGAPLKRFESTYSHLLGYGWQINSSTRLQTVGQKRLNRFGYELGNVSKLTKEGTFRDSDWGNSPQPSDAVLPDFTRGDVQSFSLVRTCR
jgi:formylglycine-generating enzyme required for sulfatase activity